LLFIDSFIDFFSYLPFLHRNFINFIC
jgi:hypothetical protein